MVVFNEYIMQQLKIYPLLKKNHYSSGTTALNWIKKSIKFTNECPCAMKCGRLRIDFVITSGGQSLYFPEVN